MNDYLTILFAVMMIGAVLSLRRMWLDDRRRKEEQRRREYQKHIDSLVDEIFPQSDLQYEEAKSKMVAEIREYFKRKKMDVKIARVWEEVPNWKEIRE